MRGRRLWEGLAGVDGAAFPEVGGVRVVVSPGSGFCPPGWVGVVVLEGAALVTVPAPGLVAAVERAVSGAPPDAWTLRTALRAADVLGPAALAYLPDGGLRPAGGHVDKVAADHPGLRALLAAVGPEDADEAGLDALDSPAFVVRDGDGSVAAAAGYHRWPSATAHLCVLTHPRHRGRGLARRVASAAVAHASAEGRWPQWRARPAASRRVADALGFREIGWQLSLRPAVEPAAGY
ncbi:GNAT family N-acetyltransferase [Streptomyces hainanensis]|nr:GNAT family N-acetyltransferase [Streptomyces hainanensis]